MASKNIGKVILFGDTQLMPRSAPEFQILMWQQWRDQFKRDFMGSSPGIERGDASGTLEVVCRMREDSLYFCGYDPDGDFDQPLAFKCTVHLKDLGEDAFVAYLRQRVGTQSDFAAQDIGRSALHDRMVEAFMGKLKECGMAFAVEERAHNGLRSLTAYWFDLLDSTGGFAPRYPATARRRMDVPPIGR